MKRRLKNAVRAVSTVLCLITAAAWLASHHRAAAFQYAHANSAYALGINEDQLAAGYHRDPPGVANGNGWKFTRTPVPVRATLDRGILGFGYWRQDYDDAKGGDRRFSAPLWFVFLTTAAAPAIWIRSRIRAARAT